MVHFYFKRKFFRICEMAFGSIKNNGINNCDVIYFHSNDTNDCSKGKLNILVQKQLTLVTSLLDSKEVVLSKIKKNCKYEIRKAEKIGIKSNIYTSESLKDNKDILDEFAKTYNEMFEIKGLSNKFNTSLINSGINSGNILISHSQYDGKQVFHAYILDNESAVLIYSASSLWTGEEKSKSKIIGWINKKLHWDDIIWLKNNKFKRYEWGGITSICNPNGIDRFKLEFGGEPVTYYNYLVAKTLLGSLYLLVVKIKGIM